MVKGRCQKYNCIIYYRHHQQGWIVSLKEGLKQEKSTKEVLP